MRTINPKKMSKVLSRFILDSFKKAKFSRAIVALSGGVDSSTSCALAVRALGENNVYPVLLPYKTLNEQEVADALSVVALLRIPKTNVTQIDITPLVEPIFSLDSTMDIIRRGNIMARMRMIVLYDQAKKKEAMVVGTENKSEYLLGYFTRFGDEASDIEPLRYLYKTQVYQLAKHLGIPEPILAKKPTAGLWIGQTDEEELGFTYQEADEILSLLYDEEKSLNDVVAKGFDRAVVEKVKNWVAKNDFKHHLPKLPKLP